MQMNRSKYPEKLHAIRRCWILGSEARLRWFRDLERDHRVVMTRSSVDVRWRFTDVINWCLSEGPTTLGRRVSRGVRYTGVEKNPRYYSQRYCKSQKKVEMLLGTILKLVGSKCLRALLLECYPLIKLDLSSLDFVIARVLMKLFKSTNTNLINDSRLFFSFLLPSEILEKQKIIHSFLPCSNILHYFGLSVDWYDCDKFIMLVDS